MDRDPYTVAIAAGDGLVARFGDVVVYTSDSAAHTGPLFAAVESVAGVQYPAAAVAERLAAFASATPSPRFGVVAPAADGLLVLVLGEVAAEIETSAGAHELSGEGASTLVDEIVRASVHMIAVKPGRGSHLRTHAQTDLRGGVVPGGGFVLRRVDTHDDQPVGDVRIEERPVNPRAATAPVVLPRTFPRPPTATMTETSTLPSVVRALQGDDGASYPLDRPYVIGRDPLNDEAVRNHLASPILVGNDPSVSRVHAHLSIDGDAVLVRDAGTPAGTFIAAPGAKAWTQIGTTPTELEPGWSLRIGTRVLTYSYRR